MEAAIYQKFTDCEFVSTQLALCAMFFLNGGLWLRPPARAEGAQ